MQAYFVFIRDPIEEYQRPCENSIGAQLTRGIDPAATPTAHPVDQSPRAHSAAVGARTAAVSCMLLEPRRRELASGVAQGLQAPAGDLCEHRAPPCRIGLVSGRVRARWTSGTRVAPTRAKRRPRGASEPAGWTAAANAAWTALDDALGRQQRAAHRVASVARMSAMVVCTRVGGSWTTDGCSA